MFSFYFWLILTDIWQQPTSLALVLDRCGARHERRNDQTPKAVTLERATELAQGEQRNKWQGPAVGGKDAVYGGCALEPMEWSATRTVIIG